LRRIHELKIKTAEKADSGKGLVTEEVKISNESD